MKEDLLALIFAALLIAACAAVVLFVLVTLGMVR